MSDKGELGENESTEAKAADELLNFGLQTIPENIQAVLALQKISQHPKGFEDIVNSDSLEDIEKAMREKKISHVIHIEDPNLWIHCKLAMKLAEFLPISEGKKADLKLIMLYHDLGKTTQDMENRPDVRAIQKKELDKGKLYKVAKGHAVEKLNDVRKGFEANGITGRKLEIFMTVVVNHMETSMPEMTGPKLAKLFESFGKNDDEIREAAEMLALAQQVDGNATMHLQFTEEGELAQLKKTNTTGKDFDKIWNRYLESKK